VIGLRRRCDTPKKVAMDEAKDATMPQTTIRDLIRTIPDFPKPGITFRDVTTLLSDANGLARAIEQLAQPYMGARIDKVAGLEARGFILGGAVVHRLGAGFVPVRKAGKLPGKVISQSYSLEYGEAVFELHEDAIAPGERVLIVDDLLATGGTAAAGALLVQRLGGQIVACAFVVDLPDLGGRAKLEGMGLAVQALCAFKGG
jgi:adenine phosphoribosyltransferase